jgi:hypothetical protein
VSCCESIEECLEMCPTAVICDDCSKCCVSKSGS